MNRCPQCHIFLYNHPQICPLCHCVTEEMNREKTGHAKELFGENAPYPNAHARQKLLRFILRLVLFIFVIAEVILILINYYTAVDYPWSLITGATLLYIYLFL